MYDSEAASARGLSSSPHLGDFRESPSVTIFVVWDCVEADSEAMDDPHFEPPPCAGCGTCCRLLVELDAADEVPEQFVVEHSGVRCMDQEGDGTCIALDRATKLCTIYEQRPKVCRAFARGSGLCREVLTRYRGR
jgi:hypothetical protein